jgi:hypothetical protein
MKNKGQVERRKGMKIGNKLLSPIKYLCLRNHDEMTGHDDIITQHLLLRSHICVCF